MTARERREREVERMARRLMRVCGWTLAEYRENGDPDWMDAWRNEARYVLRLLAAERRRAARIASKESERWKEAADADGDLTALGACANIVHAILGGKP